VTQAGEDALALADRGANGLDDDRSTHVQLLSPTARPAK
jgi:hypothetical protein